MRRKEIERASGVWSLGFYRPSKELFITDPWADVGDLETDFGRVLRTYGYHRVSDVEGRAPNFNHVSVLALGWHHDVGLHFGAVWSNTGGTQFGVRFRPEDFGAKPKRVVYMAKPWEVVAFDNDLVYHKGPDEWKKNRWFIRTELHGEWQKHLKEVSDATDSKEDFRRLVLARAIQAR